MYNMYSREFGVHIIIVALPPNDNIIITPATYNTYNIIFYI